MYRARLCAKLLLPPVLLSQLWTAPLAAADQPFPGVRKLMTPQQFEAAGLQKLSPAERAALNDWLISYTVKKAPDMRRSNEAVKAADKARGITANVRPPFSGWRGATVFYLDNGQVWRQRLPGNFAYNGDDRRVAISKNFLGFYQLTHTATGRSVGVSRKK